MARWYTRAEQRKYRDERQAQAALVANRLMGKRKKSGWEEMGWPDHDDKMDAAAMSMSYNTNLYISNPRTSFVISGMEGV